MQRIKKIVMWEVIPAIALNCAADDQYDPDLKRSWMSWYLVLSLAGHTVAQLWGFFISDCL